jgi:outer membrane protein assembly factor BamB
MWSEQGTLVMARRALFCVILGVSALSLLYAAGTTVKTGTIEAISETNQTISVKFAHADSTTELKVTKETSVRLEGAASELSALKPGMAVTVQVGSEGEAERILAHTAKDKPASSSTPKAPKPKSSTTHKSSKSKSSKTTAKTHSKKKSEKSETSPLDSLPVMTTPFASMKNPEFKGSTAAGGSRGSWPCFLGPNHDNISKESGLLTKWPPQGPAPAWQLKGLGQGYSAVSVADGIVFSMGTPDSQESLLAIGLDGKALWSVPTGGSVFQEGHGNGPRSTPTVDGGSVYALGASGDLICVDISKKAVRWHKSLTQEFAAPVPQYGYSESVLIDGSKLICTPGGQGATMAALDKNTGSIIWKCPVPSLPGAAYGSPIVADVGGAREYINVVSRGVVGVKGDGTFLWANDTIGHANVICASPLFIKDHVLVSASYNAGAALIHLTPSEQGGIQADLVYHSLEMKNHHGGMVAVGNYVYGADDQVLTCFSLETGKSVWKNRSVGKCSLTCADGRLYVRGDENGAMALVEATPNGYHETGRFLPPKNNNFPAWTYPVVAAGKLFLRDQDDLLCYSLK